MVVVGVADATVIHIVKVAAAQVIYPAVVVEGAVIPVSAFIATPTVAEAIIDAAVKADLRPPITVIPSVAIIAPSPVARSPQVADFGR
jgi:hypothetical protein